MPLKHPPFKARKRFGQNFLTDVHIIDEIVAAINPKEGENLVEIGPGHAALTRPMLEKVKKLTAIELDRDLIKILQEDPFLKGLDLIEADALKFDFNSLKDQRPFRIFGNLPYNITSPLIFKLLGIEGICDMHFMLQKEVVQRLGAMPGTPEYGRLSVMVQYSARVIPIFEVPPEAFRPRPKVTSAVVCLKPKNLTCEQQKLIPLMSEITRKAFSARRKTIRNALSGLFTADDLQNAGIDIAKRPEDLGIKNYQDLAAIMAAQGKGSRPQQDDQ